MLIKDMFEKDINRPINGVIQVEQEQAEVIKQEVSEYVITSELKKHFNKFLTVTVNLLKHQLIIQEFGLQVSLEVGNLTS